MKDMRATHAVVTGGSRGLGPYIARALARARPERELERAAAAGVELLAWGDEAYPEALHELSDPPSALFLRGALLSCDRRAVAIVGSRRATRYGLRVARTLAGDLARAGVTVVGGLARGIDAAGHEGALAAGGRCFREVGLPASRGVRVFSTVTGDAPPHPAQQGRVDRAAGHDVGAL